MAVDWHRLNSPICGLDVMHDLLAILLLQSGYNTTLVIVGASLLGAASGLIGTFSMLRKRAMVADAVAHATLPGVCLGFLIGLWLLGEGRLMWILLPASAATAMLGVIAVDAIKRFTRLQEDTAIASVLSVFFGLGMVLLSYIQTLPTAGQAGLEGVLLGSTAGMLRSEAITILLAAGVLTLIVALISKELAAFAFDPEFAASNGWPVALLDFLLMTLVTAIVVIGLRSVGLILIVAMLIIPPAAARFWTDRAATMALIAAGLSGLAGFVGASLSAWLPNLPTGAVIVLAQAGLFTISLLLAPKRGLLSAAWRQWQFRISVIQRQALLAIAAGHPLLDPWTRFLMRRQGWIDGRGEPTTAGHSKARHIERDQALWDRYLRDYPKDAFGESDWSLRPIDQVLPRDLIDELDRRVRNDVLNTANTS